MHIRLEAFEGPFDLLFHLIEKNEIDIYDIPIASLTDQYMHYLEALKQTDMESLSEFLLMAATLLEIKSKMLLPVVKTDDEDEPDPRDELVSKLIEYKNYKKIAAMFEQRQFFLDELYFRKPDASHMTYIKPKINPEDVLSDINLDMLYKVFKDVLNKRELKIDKIRSGFNSVVKDLYTVEDKINHIKNLLFLNSEMKFTQIFRKTSSKSEKITTFLAMLELIKMKQIVVFQDNIFDEIYLKINKTETK